MQILSSSSNEKIKHIKALYKDKKLRYSEGVFPVEGVNFVKDITSDVVLNELYIKESAYGKLACLEKKFQVEAFVVKDSVFDGMSDTVTPSGVIAVLNMPKSKSFSCNTVMVLDGIADAGNFGTIIRTACAFGVTDIACVDTVDPYCPKAARASMGCIYKVNIVATDTDSILKQLEDYKILSLDMGNKSISSYKRSEKVAIVVGSEAHGVREDFLKASAEILSIPMISGSVESLNAAVSAGIAMYLLAE